MAYLKTAEDVRRWLDDLPLSFDDDCRPEFLDDDLDFDPDLVPYPEFDGNVVGFAVSDYNPALRCFQEKAEREGPIIYNVMLERGGRYFVYQVMDLSLPRTPYVDVLPLYWGSSEEDARKCLEPRQSSRN